MLEENRKSPFDRVLGSPSFSFLEGFECPWACEEDHMDENDYLDLFSCRVLCPGPDPFLYLYLFRENDCDLKRKEFDS